MYKGNFDSAEMNKVIKTLDAACKEIDTCVSSINALDVPDFDCSGWLKGLPDNLKNCKQQCSSDVDWCTKTIESFESFNNESTTDINSVVVQTEFSKAHYVKNI